MSLSIPIGYYLPGESIVHRADPRIKLTVLAVFAVALFATSGWLGLAIGASMLVVGFVLSKVPFSLALKTLKPMLVLLALTLAFNAFTFEATSDAAWVSLAGPTVTTGSFNGSLAWLLGGVMVPENIPIFGSFGIRTLGAINGFYFIVRITLLIFATTLLTFTTSTLDLTDALVSILGPLGRVGVPVEDVATMCSIALRFIPLTSEEVDRLVLAQRSRGAVFDQGSLIARLRAWIPVLVPLFVNLFRRADKLANAMDARCYTGLGRTHLRVMRPSRKEIVSSIALMLALLLVGFCI